MMRVALLARRGARVGAALLGALLASRADPVSAADWQAGADPAWQQILAAARQEGQVVVAGPADLAKPFTAAFLGDTGVQVEYLAGEFRTISSRVIREIRAQNVTIDVMLTGTAELPQVKEGLFENERSRLKLPGVTAPENWAGGELKWIDNDKRYMLQTQAYVANTPFYDASSIATGDLTSWQDMLKPGFKHKIAVYDPRAGGPGQAVAGYIGAQFGIDFLKSLYVGQDVVYSLDGRQMAEWVSRGVYWIALGVQTPDYLVFHDAGLANLKPAALADGPGNLSGGTSVILLPKGAPHPNAATLFLNWYASQPGQAAFSRAYRQPSRRTDVSEASIVDFTIPKPGAKYLDQYNEEWVLHGRARIISEIIAAIGGK
jgi:ABC-type Fe3+ transport system substrate-binding protein